MAQGIMSTLLNIQEDVSLNCQHPDFNPGCDYSATALCAWLQGSCAVFLVMVMGGQLSLASC